MMIHFALIWKIWLMGMYDNLKISTSKLPLSDSEKLSVGENPDWQTKDFECILSTAEITDEGKLKYLTFRYDWDENADTLHMISNIKMVVQEKWRLASRTTGTGTTTAIGSIKEISRIISGQGDFSSEQEFLNYWRNH